MVEIPDELVRMFREQRVIPFIGSGMSANLQLPDWDSLLRKIHSDDAMRGRGVRMEGGYDSTFEELQSFAGGDRLRIAEFFYLLAGKQMGIIRRVIEPHLTNQNPNQYGCFTDLVNLGSPLIYTTNFNDLIERDHRQLGVDVQPILNSRDIALSQAAGAPQVVKYHGDLSDDSSLVITESSYYRRLNFESPLDLKFRADLLGSSVLFIGYSLNDPNVRVIWFRLLDMMRDVDFIDRHKSYVITFSPNPVQERLYRDAGIEPIVLDPEGVATPADFGPLLADFLCSLAIVVADTAIPGTDSPAYASATLVERVATQVDRLPPTGMWFRRARTSSPDLDRLSEIRYPAALLPILEALFIGPASGRQSLALTRIALRLTEEGSVADSVIGYLLLVSSTEMPWDAQSFNLEKFVGMPASQESRQEILRRTEPELSYHEQQQGYDEDLFYLLRPVLHLAGGGFGATSEEAATASSMSVRVEDLYPGLTDTLRNRSTGLLSDLVAEYQPDEHGASPDSSLGDVPF